MDANRQLTALQRRTFFAEVRKAALEIGEEQEAYRRRILREELGVDHLADVSRTSGFDRLMQRVYRDMGEYESALDFIGGDVVRLRYLAERAAAEIVGDDARNVARYIAGVMVRMRLSDLDRDALAIRLQRPDGWDDFNPASLRKVVAALRVHLRRRS